MRIEIETDAREFRYRLQPEADDHHEARRGFADAPTRFELAHHEYRVLLPEVFTGLHPDLHAAAIWYAVKPLVGSTLRLPFAVSERFADVMRRFHAVELAAVDPRLAPRARPRQREPVLLFSGGMDSMAASLVFPAETHHLFLDRIPHATAETSGDGLVDLVKQREACDAVRADGRRVHETRDDHEYLYRPYPMWHSDMPLLSALYLADSLDIDVIDTGEVLDATALGGYQAGDRTSWEFRRGGMGRRPPADQSTPVEDPRRAFLAALQLRRAESIAGLSEVATTAIVSRSHQRGKSFSCYYNTTESFCLHCDKCMKKLLLRYVVDGEEAPAALVDHFLSYPHLRKVFTRRFLDWHHVWYYLFQRLRCRHWFVDELRRQAREGPDLAFLEKWYPGSLSKMVAPYRDQILERIQAVVPTMTPTEVAALEGLRVPPFEPPDLQRLGPPRQAATGGPVASSDAGPAPPPAADAAPPGPAEPGPQAPTAAGPAAPAEPAPAVPADAATQALHDLLRGWLAAHPELRFAGFAVESITLERDGGLVHAVLARAPEEASAVPPARFGLLLDAGRRLARPYARVGTIGISYLSSTPLDTPEKRESVRLFARGLAAAARAATGTGGSRPAGRR